MRYGHPCELGELFPHARSSAAKIGPGRGGQLRHRAAAASSGTVRPIQPSHASR